MFVVFFFFKFWKPFSLNSNSNAKHLFVARSALFCGRLAQNSPARGSDGLMAKTGRRAGRGTNAHRWASGAAHAVTKRGALGGWAAWVNNPGIHSFSRVQKPLLRLSCFVSSAAERTTSRRRYEELTPDLDLGPLQGNSARESPGRGPAWGQHGSHPQQCESVITQSPIIKPGYFPCQVNDPTPRIRWRVAEWGLQGSVRQYATEVLCSSYGAGPSLSPGVFRTTRGHVIPSGNKSCCTCCSDLWAIWTQFEQ